MEARKQTNERPSSKPSYVARDPATVALEAVSDQVFENPSERKLHYNRAYCTQARLNNKIKREQKKRTDREYHQNRRDRAKVAESGVIDTLVEYQTKNAVSIQEVITDANNRILQNSAKKAKRIETDGATIRETIEKKRESAKAVAAQRLRNIDRNQESGDRNRGAKDAILKELRNDDIGFCDQIIGETKEMSGGINKVLDMANKSIELSKNEAINLFHNQAKTVQAVADIFTPRKKRRLLKSETNVYSRKEKRSQILPRFAKLQGAEVSLSETPNGSPIKPGVLFSTTEAGRPVMDTEETSNDASFGKGAGNPFRTNNPSEFGTPAPPFKSPLTNESTPLAKPFLREEISSGVIDLTTEVISIIYQSLLDKQIHASSNGDYLKSYVNDMNQEMKNMDAEKFYLMTKFLCDLSQKLKEIEAPSHVDAESEQLFKMAYSLFDAAASSVVDKSNDECIVFMRNAAFIIFDDLLRRRSHENAPSSPPKDVGVAKAGEAPSASAGVSFSVSEIGLSDTSAVSSPRQVAPRSVELTAANEVASKGAAFEKGPVAPGDVTKPGLFDTPTTKKAPSASAGVIPLTSFKSPVAKKLKEEEVSVDHLLNVIKIINRLKECVDSGTLLVDPVERLSEKVVASINHFVGVDNTPSERKFLLDWFDFVLKNLEERLEAAEQAFPQKCYSLIEGFASMSYNGSTEGFERCRAFIRNCGPLLFEDVQSVDVVTHLELQVKELTAKVTEKDLLLKAQDQRIRSLVEEINKLNGMV